MNNDNSSLDQQVFYNLKLLYAADTPHEQRKKADNFLRNDFFRHGESWNVLFRILQNNNLEPQYILFASISLRTKIAKNFQQLPAESLEQIRDMLFNLVKAYCTDSKILTQLALVNADFIVQQPNWKSIISDLANCFLPSHTKPLLHILKYCPEEIDERKLPLAKPQKDAIFNTFLEIGPQVLQLFEHIWAKADSEEILILLLECFASWAKIFSQVNPAALLNSSLFKSTCQALWNPATFKDACHALLKILTISRDSNQNQQKDGNQSQQKEGWTAVQSSILDAVLQAKELLNEPFQKGDKEQQNHIARLFVFTTQDCLDILVKKKEDLHSLLSVIITFSDLSTHQNFEVAETAFDFWFHLQEDSLVADYMDNPSPLEMADDLIKPAAKHAVKNILTSIEIPQNYDNLDEEELYSWHSFRRSGRETLKQLFLYLRDDLFLQCIGERLEEAFGGKNIRQIESCLYLLANTGLHMGDGPNDILKQILFHALQTKPNWWKYRLALTDYIRMLTKKRQIIDQQMICQMLQYVVEGLVNQRGPVKNDGKEKIQPVSKESAQALKDICRYKMDQVASLMNQLLQVYNSTQALDHHERCDFIWAICELFPVHDESDVLSALNTLLSAPLQHVRTGWQSKDRETVHNALRLISEVFRRYNFPPKQNDHPLVQALEQIWPELSPIMEFYSKDDDIMEKTTRIIKSTIRTCPDHYFNSSLTKNVLEKIVTLFADSPRSCFLYLASTYVDEYGDRQGTQSTFKMCLVEITKRIQQLLTCYTDFSQSPDLVEDYYELLTRYFKSCPSCILNIEFLTLIMQITIPGLPVQHADAADALLLFLETMIRQGTDLSNSREDGRDHRPRKKKKKQTAPNENKQLIQQLLANTGEPFLKAIFSDIAYDYFKRKLKKYCQILEAWYRLNPEMLQTFLVPAVASIPCDTIYPTKEEFVRKYFDYQLGDYRKRKHAVQDFAGACERWRESQNYQD